MKVLDRFIVLEGLDGAGTTTQLELAECRLRSMGVAHCCTSEPTSGPIGKLIRDVLAGRLSVQPWTLAMLFAADRTEHLREPKNGILERLDRGEAVISDRYLFSSLAYQSLGCDFSFVHSLNAGFPVPRHLVFLDTPVKESQRRLQLRTGSGQELFEGAEIQERILANYRRSFDLYGGSGMELHILDGAKSAEEVFENFWKIIAAVPMLKA